ncbi:MAG: penicillin acylase family protein, partial [Nocardioidaceae bacterium]
MRPHLTRRLLAATTAGVLALTLAPAVIAPAPADEPPPDIDYCDGQCEYILPPGQAGNATIKELLDFTLTGNRPPHFSDQLGKYANLVRGYSGLTDEQLNRFFNEESFGVP